jgi:hypothetical protein
LMHSHSALDFKISLLKIATRLMFYGKQIKWFSIGLFQVLKMANSRTIIFNQ